MRFFIFSQLLRDVCDMLMGLVAEGRTGFRIREEKSRFQVSGGKQDSGFRIREEKSRFQV
jgi:hypothetical protein